MRTKISEALESRESIPLEISQDSPWATSSSAKKNEKKIADFLAHCTHCLCPTQYKYLFVMRRTVMENTSKTVAHKSSRAAFPGVARVSTVPLLP